MSCIKENCKSPYYAKGYCANHYQRNRLGRDLNKPVGIKNDDVGRLLSHITLENDCWEWQASMRGKGYAGMKMGKRMVSAHRVSYELFVDEIPSNSQVDHLCMNKLCINPDHLELVDNRENQYRAFKARGHWPIQGRKPKPVICTQCGITVMSIMYERTKYCSNACRCKAARQRRRALS